MIKYLALLRGINLGRHNKVPMKGLISLLQECGCENITTYIQSGNAIFDSQCRSRNKLSGDISLAMSKRFGFSPALMLLTASELQDAIAYNPFPTDDGKALHFLFLEKQPETPDLDRLTALKRDSEDIVLGDKVVYLYAADGVGRSKMAMSVERCLGVVTTGRNWNTVSKLASMLETDNQPVGRNN